MDNYILLMEEFYEDFKNKNNLALIVKKYFIICFITLFIYSFLTIISIFVDGIIKTIFRLISVIVFAFAILFSINYVREISKEKRLLYEKKNIIEVFVRMLKHKKYRIFDNITMLNELYDYYDNKLKSCNIKNNERSTLYSFFYTFSNIMIPIFITELIYFIINPNDNLLIFYIICIITIFSVSLKMFIWCVNEFNFRNDDTYLNILLFLIRERKIQIIESRNNNILNKIRYVLKLREFS